MRICVLLSSYERSSSVFRELDPYADPGRFLPEHLVDVCLIEKATALAQIRDLFARRYDAFINLCDGARDEDGVGIEVVEELERLGAAFTGAGSAFFEPTREAMKAACARAGVDTPRFAFVSGREDAARAALDLRFPMIVKHPNSYGSIGMTRRSRVETPSDLADRVEETARAFGGALIEEFIEGRELTALVAEPGEGESSPRAFTPVEFHFPPGETFKHFDLKWIDHRQMSWVPVVEPELAARLMDLSRRLFTSMDGSGYGRCDFRMDEEGRLFLLEINPNCGIFYPEGVFGCADFILSRDPAGFRGFLKHLLRCAARRAHYAASPRLRAVTTPAAR